MRKFLVFLCAMSLVFCVATGTWATTYTGSIIGGDTTLFGTDGWSDATLSWTVNDVTNPGFWRYDYNFTDVTKELSHIMIELSASFTIDNIIDISSDYDRDAPKTYETGSDNPGMLGDLFGIKWDTTEDLTSYDFWIVSDRVPMWGDFYAKDGVDGDGKVYAYNKKFGYDTTADIVHGNAGGWVLVPDTHNVPIPSTMLLFGCGLIGLAVVGRKKIQ